MKRIKFLLVISVLVLVISIFSLGVMAASTWKIAHVCVSEPDNSYHATCLKFKEIVEEKTDGGIKFEIYPQRQLGSDREILEGVQTGLIEASASTLGPASAFGIEIVDLLELPFLYKNIEHLDAVLNGPIGKELLDGFEKVGFKALGFFDDGIANFTCSKRQLHSAEDFKGLQMRTMEAPIKIATMKALGGNPVPIAYAELYSALQTGIVDGQSNAHWVTVARSLWEVQKYVSCTQHCWGGAVLLVNLKKFNALSLGDQQIVIEAGKEACQYGRKMGRGAEDKHLQTCIDRGMIVDLHPDTGSMREATEQVYGDIYNKHHDWKQVILEIKKLASNF
ncbi:TRAP transporter substrate-binding protein [Candidatus Atribacteria bacterium 1244-E10-H5-B2]|nr:MAG: TRAP transporter substrate-binding protein [Candidatus Atribacteria bacterium 1244-E10-H5-B2]